MAHTKKLLILIGSLAVLCLGMTACSTSWGGYDDYQHEHTYSGEWSYDAVNHWRKPTCDDTNNLWDQADIADLAEHTWVEATCTEAKTCSVCQATVGQPLGHTGGTATCQRQAVCTRCDESYGDYAAHDMTAKVTSSKYRVSLADCQGPAVYYYSCNICGTAARETFSFGEKNKNNHISAELAYDGLGGDMHAKTHVCCGADAGIEACSGGTATCQDLASCQHCGLEYGMHGDHLFTRENARSVAVVQATCETSAVYRYFCEYCDEPGSDTDVYEAGEPLGHLKKTDATCTDKATCSRCNKEYGEPLGHTWVAPTCTADGYCSVCDEKGDAALDHRWIDATCTTARICDRCYTEDSAAPALGHEWNDGERIAEATCDTAAKKKYTCKREGCGETKEEEDSASPATGHNYDVGVVTAPTCKDKGYKVYTCQNEGCGDSYRVVDDITPYAAHTWDNEAAVERTCTVCGTTEVGSETTHSFDAGVVTEAPTCMATGIKTYTCTDPDCDVSYTEVLPMLPHNMAEKEVPATCLVGKHTEYTCQNEDCTYSYKSALGVPLAHEYEFVWNLNFEKPSVSTCTMVCKHDAKGEHSIPLTVAVTKRTTAATCTADGENRYILRADWNGSYEVKEIVHTLAMIPHSYVTRFDDNEHYEVCLVCKNEANRAVHTYSDYISNAPTCTEKGEKLVRCTVCDKAWTETVPAPGHIWVDADCDTPKTCSGCFITEGAPLGHTFTDADCDTPKTCSVCDATEGEPLGHDEVPHAAQAPTCTEIGWEAYVTCSRCDYTTYAPVEALGHDEVAHESLPATCTTDGHSAYLTCTRCDYNTREKVEKLGHDNTQYPKKDPTCTEGGYGEYETCSRCDHTTYAPVEALGPDGTNPSDPCARCGKYDPDHCVHTYSRWTIIELPTKDIEGKAERTCQKCDRLDEKVLEKRTSFDSTVITLPDDILAGTKEYTVTGVTVAGMYRVQYISGADTGSGYTYLYNKDTALGEKVATENRIKDLTTQFHYVYLNEGNNTLALKGFDEPAAYPEFAGATLTLVDACTYDSILPKRHLRLAPNGTNDYGEDTVKSIGGFYIVSAFAKCTYEEAILTYTFTDKANAANVYSFVLSKENGNALSDLIREEEKGSTYTTMYTELGMLYLPRGEYTVTVKMESEKSNAYVILGATFFTLNTHETHTYQADTVPPTCVKDGYTADICECGEVKEGTEAVLPATGIHTPGEAQDLPATCTENGYEDRVFCTVCGAVTEPGNTLTALGHEMTKHDRTEPDCTTDGNVLYWHCSVCEKNYGAETGGEEITDTVLPKTGHDFEGGVCKNCNASTCTAHEGAWVITQASGDQPATATRTCTNCGQPETKTLTLQDIQDGGQDIKASFALASGTEKDGKLTVTATAAGIYKVVYKMDTWAKKYSYVRNDKYPAYVAKTYITDSALTARYYTYVYLDAGVNTLSVASTGDQKIDSIVLAERASSILGFGEYTDALSSLKNNSACFVDATKERPYDDKLTVTTAGFYHVSAFVYYQETFELTYKFTNEETGTVTSVTNSSLTTKGFLDGSTATSTYKAIGMVYLEAGTYTVSVSPNTSKSTTINNCRISAVVLGEAVATPVEE